MLLLGFLTWKNMAIFLPYPLASPQYTGSICMSLCKHITTHHIIYGSEEAAKATAENVVPYSSWGAV
jgi:hypothetical protein